MNCEEFRDKISALIDGELPEEERKEMLAHRTACAECDRYATEIEHVDEVLRAEPLPDLPPELVEKLKKIELEWTVPYVSWRPYVKDSLISAAAAVVVFTVSMMGAGYWRDIAIALIPAVAWAMVLARFTLKGLVPASIGLLEARALTLAHRPA